MARTKGRLIKAKERAAELVNKKHKVKTNASCQAAHDAGKQIHKGPKGGNYRLVKNREGKPYKVYCKGEYGTVKHVDKGDWGPGKW